MSAKRYMIVRVTDDGLSYYRGNDVWSLQKRYAKTYRSEIEVNDINTKLKRKFETEIKLINKESRQ